MLIDSEHVRRIDIVEERSDIVQCIDGQFHEQAPWWRMQLPLRERAAIR